MYHSFRGKISDSHRNMNNFADSSFSNKSSFAGELAFIKRIIELLEKEENNCIELWSIAIFEFELLQIYLWILIYSHFILSPICWIYCRIVLFNRNEFSLRSAAYWICKTYSGTLKYAHNAHEMTASDALYQSYVTTNSKSGCATIRTEPAQRATQFYWRLSYKKSQENFPIEKISWKIFWSKKCSVLEKSFSATFCG